MLSRLVLRPRAAPSLAGHGPGRPPPGRPIAAAALALDGEVRSDWRSATSSEPSEMARREEPPSDASPSAPPRTRPPPTSRPQRPPPPSRPRPPPKPSQPGPTPRQKMPRGGARPPSFVRGEPSRRAESFPRLESGGDITLAEPVPRTPASTSYSRSDFVADGFAPAPYGGALAYRGAGASDADARLQSVAARLEREHPAHPAAPTTTTTPTTPPRLARASQIPSVIHALLPVASRASAAAALAHLEYNPRKLNPAAVAALDTWAFHTTDESTRKRLRLLARGEGVRIFPIDHGTRWNHASWKLERRGHRRPNKFLWQKYPPLDSPGMSARGLLRYQHALLLAGKGYVLPEILGLLHGMEASSAHRLDALHLALAYANATQVTGLLDGFATHPHAVAEPTRQRFSRQTVHLAILTRLRRPTRIADVRKLLARFDGPPRRTPGPETWRHVAKHALAHDDADLAHLAFDGGKAELGALRAAAAADPAPRPFPPLPEKDAQARRRAAYDAGRATAADPPPPKFLHLGKHTTRWNFLLHACGDRGWAVRGPSPDGESPVPRLLRRWTWLGDEGSFARRTDLVPEAEVLAEARLEKAGSKAVDDTTPADFGMGLGRRVVVDGVAYRVKKFEGRKVAVTSWMRRRTRALRSSQRGKEAREDAGRKPAGRRASEWEWDEWKGEDEVRGGKGTKKSGIGKGAARKGKKK